jgi:aspartate aminotransferase-like enzyme
MEGQTPTTPAVPIVVALETALDLLIHEGPSVRRKRYHGLSQSIRAAAQRLGLELLLSSDDHSATAITTLCLPRGMDALKLHRYLFERGVTVWHPHNLSRLGCNAIQVSVMGAIGETEVNYFLDLLREYVSQALGN